MNLYENLIKIDLKKGMGITGITDEFFCVYLNSIFIRNEKNILVVVNSLYEANKLYTTMINHNNNTYLFPMDDFLTSEALAISPDLEITRLETLNSIVNCSKSIIITNLMGYLRFLPNKRNYIESIIKLKVGDVIEPKELVDKLISSGYTRDTIVNKTGEFAVRGFIKIGRAHV